MPTFNEFFLPVFDTGMKKNRTMLGAVPDHDVAFRPDPKSMPVGRLAFHIAGLATLAGIILLNDKTKVGPDSPSQDAAVTDVFLNHLIHHRRQLTVYIRMLGGKVPSLYGPSAGEQ